MRSYSNVAPKRFVSHVQSEVTCNEEYYDHDTDDVENIHFVFSARGIDDSDLKKPCPVRKRLTGTKVPTGKKRE